MSISLTFYEKPGCIGNARQKAMLRAQGHTLSVRNLLAEPWTAERLRPFFGELPVRAWFNQTAPRVKSGEVRPDALDEPSALALMVADPLLIRRPLIECEFGVGCGFETSPLLTALGVTFAAGDDLQSCQQVGPDPRCDIPAEPAET